MPPYKQNKYENCCSYINYILLLKVPKKKSNKIRYKNSLGASGHRGELSLVVSCSRRVGVDTSVSVDEFLTIRAQVEIGYYAVRETRTLPNNASITFL